MAARRAAEALGICFAQAWPPTGLPPRAAGGVGLLRRVRRAAGVTDAMRLAQEQNAFTLRGDRGISRGSRRGEIVADQAATMMWAKAQ